MTFRGEYASEQQIVAPPVLGEQPSSTDGADAVELPATVYLPTDSVSVEDEHARLELRYTVDGALALVVFTSVECVVEACGEDQSWIAVAGAALPAVAEQTGAQVVLQDVALPDTDQRETETEQ